jgi:hypothetical protein
VQTIARGKLALKAMRTFDHSGHPINLLARIGVGKNGE